MKGEKKIWVGLFVIGIAAIMVLQNMPVSGTENSNIPWANAKKLPVKLTMLGSATTSNAGNVLVSVGSDYDDFMPAITTDNAGHIVVTWTQETSATSSEIGWAYSSDGTTWTAYATIMGGLMTHSDISWQDCKTYTGLFGVYLDEENEYNGFYAMSDVTDPENTLQIYYWSSEAPDQVYSTISDMTYLEGQYYDVDGPACLYIYHFAEMGYDIPACPEQMITDIEGGQGEGTFDGQSHLHTAPADNPDMAGENMDVHYVWDYYNESLANYQIVWKKIIPVEGDTDSTDIEFTPYQQYIDTGRDPAISKSGDNVIIVYMNNDAGNWDIKCAYSNDDGATWNIGTVVAGSGDEMYPDVYIAGTSVYCAYVSNGNLYMVKSADGGATWSEPLQINDVDGSVVAEPGCIDVSQAGIVWTDNRNGNYDIYYATLPAPHLEITISGMVGAKVHIENTGLEPATNVHYTIDVTGGLVILNKHAEGTIDTLNPGESQDISIMPIGIGKITITATADGTTKSASGFLLGPLILGLQ